MSVNNSNSKQAYHSTNTVPVSTLYDEDSSQSPTIIVEDLLHGTNEWRDVKDIVRLTLRALTDVVKAQSETIREIERQLPQKAGKQEMNNQLSQKANLGEVSRTVAEIAQGIDNKISYDDLQVMLKDFVSKNDLQYHLSSKVSIEEVRQIISSRASSLDLKQEIQLLNIKVDEMSREFIKHGTGQLSAASGLTSKELEDIFAQLDTKANITDVNEALETKANKTSVSTALHRKANKADLEENYAKKNDFLQLTQKLEVLSDKANTSTIEKLTEVIQNKVDRSEYKQLCSQIEAKQETKDLSNVKSELKQTHGSLESIKQELTSLSKSVASLTSEQKQANNSLSVQDGLRNEILTQFSLLQKNQESKDVEFQESQFKLLESFKEEILFVKDSLQNSNDERYQVEQQLSEFMKQQCDVIQGEVSQELEKIYVQLEDTTKQIDDIIALKIDRKEFGEYKSKTEGMLDLKVDLSEVQQALNVCQADTSARFVEHKEEIKLKLRNVESDILGTVSKKANLADITESLNSKADVTAIQNLLGKRANSKEVDILRASLNKLAQEVESKLSLTEFDNHLAQTKKALDVIQKDMMLKSNIKDVCALLDTKASIDDMNKALTEIFKELDQKSAQEDFNNYVNGQAIINETVCTENIVGRWTWKSQNLKQGNLIPWETQVVNTLLDNFIWEKDKSYIMCVTPGLYQVTFGIFCGKKPIIQLLVNGELAITSEGNSASQKLVEYGTHSNGSITGMTLTDYLLLPERSRISLIYDGDFAAEGFLGLKRL